MLHVGRGMDVGALTVFPIWTQVRGARVYSTDTRSLSVTEHEDGASVSMLSASNGSSTPVMVLEGHLFEGGWQHRMATASMLVQGGDHRTPVEVVCVEQSRWGGASHQETHGRRATPFVRSGL